MNNFLHKLENETKLVGSVGHFLESIEVSKNFIQWVVKLTMTNFKSILLGSKCSKNDVLRFVAVTDWQVDGIILS